MDVLDSFVPADLLQRIWRASAHRSTPVAVTFRGAVLFVDISGYTTLAESLCNDGTAGVEQLGRILNAAFQAHVQAVRDRGGEIAGFAGDAFIAYWAADDGDVLRAVRQASDCAGALHAASKLAATNVALPPLHIGVGAGVLWAARLGAEGRWRLLLAGPAVRAACAATARGAAGDTIVAVDDSVAMASSPSVELDNGGEDGRRLPSTHVADVIGHDLKRLQEYAHHGYDAWIPQQRTICALFVRIDGLDDTTADPLSQYQAVVAALDSALRPHVGSSGTLLLDDKGLVFTVCLGMPHDAHGDDALRAVRAGLAIRAELQQLGLDCAVGIASGSGVCMPLGGPARRHYWAVGRFMHVAGRLMEAAGAGLLCTEEVAAQVRHDVRLARESLGPTKTTFARPISPYRVHGVATVDGTHVLFGREAEQAVLERYLDHFEDGRGAIVWMVGEAGLGKTSLVQHFRRSAARRSLTCRVGGAGSLGELVPYAAWRPVFAEWLGDTPTLNDLTATERLQRLAAVRHPDLAPLVNAVIPGFLDETPAVHSLVGQARADATVSVLSEVIGVNAGDRFVLVLEDCHWMDTASWRLTVRVAQDYPQALVVLTSREGGTMPEFRILQMHERFSAMELTPLSDAAIGSLVASVMTGGLPAPDVVGEITQRSLGNPLFAREYARLLAESDRSDRIPAVRPRPGTAPRPAVPPTINALIASRLDSLSVHEDVTLKAASVFGEKFSVELIASVVRTGSDDALLARGPFDAIVRSLADRELIVSDSESPTAFAFRHAIIREVAYEQLTLEQRRELHGRAAAAIEQRFADDVRPHAAALAHHALRAGVPRAIVKYSDVAAAQALAAGAFEVADGLLAACIAHADASSEVTLADRIRWHRQLADARHGQGQLELRSDAAHQALRLAGRPRARTRVGMVLRSCGHVCGMPLRRYRSQPPAPAAATRLLDLARAYRHSAEVSYFNNDMLGMICDSVSAVAAASALPPSPELVGASTELGGILSVAGLRSIGERILHRAIALAEAAGERPLQAYAHMISCLYYVGVGEWESAEISARRCQSLCEPMDERVNWTNAQAVRFWMSYYRNHNEAAWQAACGLRDRAAETHNRQHEAWALRFMGLCALRDGRTAEAVDQLRAAFACLDETAALNERVPTLGFLALAHLRNGDAAAARDKARDGLALMAQVRRPIGQSTLEGYSSLAAVALEAWRRDRRSPEWQRGVTDCLRVLNRYRKGFPIGEPRYRLHRGDYLRAGGSLAAAARSYRRGQVAASRLGMAVDLNRCSQALQELTDSSIPSRV